VQYTRQAVSLDGVVAATIKRKKDDFGALARIPILIYISIFTSAFFGLR